MNAPDSEWRVESWSTYPGTANSLSVYNPADKEDNNCVWGQAEKVSSETEDGAD